MSLPPVMVRSVETRRDGCPFPVAPEDVPDAAVRAVKRTLLRNGPCDPMDDELARLVVAVVIASLSQPGGSGQVT